MTGGFRPILLACLVFAASIGQGAETIELVLDQSNAMWRPLPDGIPRIVAVRSAIESFLALPALSDLRIEIGLSTFGGRTDLSKSAGCEDVDRILPTGPVDLAAWSTALGDLDPRGGRPLIRGIEEAGQRLAGVEGNRRIVAITAGGDLCFRDLGRVLDRFSRDDHPIQLRVIGIDLDQGTAESMSSLTPTRIASDAATLLGFLRWAMLPSAAGARRPEWLDLELTHGSAPLRHASMRLKGPTPEEGTAADIDDGRVRLRLTPGRYGATIEGEGLETIELTGIVHDGSSRTVGIALSASPEVTLEIDPERPVAGNEAHVQFWGAPAGTNWLVLAVTGSPLSDFLVRSPATGRSGEVSLSLPDTPTALEIRFATEVGNGVLQLLGRIAFDSARRRISLRTPEHAEIRTPLTMGWSGDALNGDHVAIDRRGPDGDEPVFCLPVGDGGKLKTTSPNMPGEYVVRYVTRRGRTVARSSIDIFEVLATLDGPTQSPPGVEIEVSWTGPESEQDFLSIASIDEDDEEYMSFTPASSGSPARLTTPKDPGEYELRYVRAADGEVLAREPLAVVAVEIDLEVPPEVGVGTRFEVSWSGTSEPGDFITVAPEGSEPGKKLDSTYASLGSPVSLAAPFKPGRYVVRYISGTSRQIVVEAPIVAR